MKYPTWKLAIAAAWIMAGAPFVKAQTGGPYDLSWFSIDGGGGTSTGMVYTLSGTIGQPDAGRMAGANYSLVGGFWGVVTAIQTEGAPWLTITQTNYQITVSWPLSATGFVLEETPALLGSPIPWTRVAFPYQTNATDVFVKVAPPVGNRYYRLHKP